MVSQAVSLRVAQGNYWLIIAVIGNRDHESQKGIASIEEICDANFLLACLLNNEI